MFIMPTSTELINWKSKSLELLLGCGFTERMSPHSEMTYQPFKIYESYSKSTIKNTKSGSIIYLVIRTGNRTSKLYSEPTIYRSLIEQLAHLVTPTALNDGIKSSQYYTNLDKLTAYAKSRGWYDPFSVHDSKYPNSI